MKIWIYPRDGSSPSNYYEITSYITNEVNEQKRSDDAFALTTFKAMIPSSVAWSSLVKYNIQPFTIFEIAPNNESIFNSNNKRYFGYSTCTKYLRTQSANATYYVHDITLIDPLALLEAIQIGTRAFTNHTDLEYLQRLSQQIKNQTDIRVTFGGTWSATEPHSFSFDKGATAFSIANEIFKINNYKMSVSMQPYDAYPYNLKLTITPIKLSEIQEVSINTNYLTLEQFTQNQDDYCQFLESQVDNVVDRNTTTKYNDLTVRSDDNFTIADNCYIELPAKVESVTKLEIYSDAYEEITIVTNQADYDTIVNTYGSSDISWLNILNVLSYWLSPLMNQLTDETPFLNPFEYVFMTTDAIPSEVGFVGYKRSGASYVVNSTDWREITESIKEEKIYQALTPQQQTKYCYYRSGDNKIKGIYQYYKENWIQTLLGVTGDPMIKHCLDDYSKKLYSNVLTSNNTRCYLSFDVNNRTTNPLNVMFRVTAHPISNQYIRDEKATANLVNASAYSYASRSYGNSANFIDYDVMRKNISISNSYLGTPELTLQFFDNCNITENTKFYYNSKLWYAMSVVMNITREHIVYTVNASTNYDKQAECIGVKTQFESTKIDLENIKERHLYFKDNTSFIFNKTKTYYMRISFEYEIPTISTFYLPLNIYAASNGVTLTATTIDNYSIGKYLSLESSNRYIQNDARYCDSNGEAKLILDLKIITFNTDLTIDQSRKLPLPSGNLPSETTIAEIIQEDDEKGIIYKDEHESLSFTIYLPNASLN